VAPVVVLGTPEGPVSPKDPRRLRSHPDLYGDRNGHGLFGFLHDPSRHPLIRNFMTPAGIVDDAGLRQRSAEHGFLVQIRT
jgi:hypothetical protein